MFFQNYHIYYYLVTYPSQACGLTHSLQLSSLQLAIAAGPGLVSRSQTLFVAGRLSIRDYKRLSERALIISNR